MGPRRASETLWYGNASSHDSVQHDLFMHVNGCAYSFMCISVLSKSVPIFFLSCLSGACGTMIVALNKNFFFWYNDKKGCLMFENLFVVWKVLSLFFLQLIFLWILQGMYYSCSFIGDVLLPMQTYWSSERLIASPKSHVVIYTG